uniref:Apple domain-containing protein n=1 Tax=Globodera rostochiensis TaxID=31243 RepID=A0A914HW78_GLORO
MHTSSFCTSSRQRSLLLLLLPLFLLLFHPTHSTPAASTATATASSPTSPGCPPTTFHAQAISPRQLASVEFFHTNPSVSSASVCAVQCAQHSLCRSAVFNHDTRTCALSHQNWLSHCQSSKERFKSFHLTTDGADALSLISCIDQCGSTRTDNGGFEHLLNILRARGAIDGGGPRFAPSNGALTGNVPPMPTRPIDPANATPLKKNRKASDRANELTDHFPMPDFLSLHEAPVLSKMQRQLLPAGSSEENSAAGNGFLSAVRQLHQMQKKLESLLREAAHRQDKVMAEEEGGKQDGTVVPLLVEKENNGDGEGQRRAIWWKAKDLRIRVDHDGKSSSPTSPSTPPASTRLPPSPMPSSTVQLPTSNYSVHYESSGELLDERVVVQTVHNGTERRVKSGGFIKLLKPGESIGIATAPEGPSAPPDTAIRLLNTAADRQIPIDLINIIGAGRSLPEQPKIRSSSSTSSAGTNFANSSTGQPPPAALRSLEEADQQQQQTVVINGKIVSPELLVKLLRTELADGKRTKASEAASTPRVHNKNEEEEGFLKLITLHGVAGQKAARLGQNGTFSPPALSLDMANSATDKPDDPGTIVCFRRIRRQQLTAPAAFATLKGITLNECRCACAQTWAQFGGGGAGNESTGGAEVGAVQKRCRSLQYDDTAEEGAKCDMNSADHNGKLELMTSSTGRKSDYFYVSCEIKYLLKTADKMCRDGLGLMGKTTPAALSSTSTWTSTTPPSITDNTKASTAAVPATAPSSSSSSSSDVASSVSSSTPSSSLTSVSTSSSSSTDSSSSIPSSSSTDSSSSIPSSSSSTDSSSSIPSSASLPLSSTVQSLSSSALSSSSSSTSTSSSSTSTSSSSTSTSSSSSSTSSSSSSTSTSSSSSSTSTSTSSSSSSTSTSTSSSSSSTSSSSSSSVVPLFAHSTGGVTEVGACFEHIAGFAMRGTAAGLERAVSLEQCECLCANSLTSRLYSFQCASATYYQADRDCVLNLDSRHSSPNLFGKAAGGDSELLEEANNANANANANVLVTYLGMLCSAAERAISQLANNPRGHEECLALIGNRAPPNTPTAPTTTTTTPTTTAPEGNNGTTKIAEVDGGTSTSSTAINSDRCFREQPNYVLEGMALAVETNVTVDQCKCFCAEAEVRYGSACQSVQFYYGSMTCLLNRENRLSDPEHFNFDAQGNGRHSYFDYRCGAESDTAVNYVNTKCGNGTAAVPLLLLANNATIAIGTTVLSNLSSPSTTAPPFRILKKKWRGGRRKKKKNGGQKIGKEVGGMATTTDGTTLKTVGTTIELPTTTTVPTVVPSSTKLNAIIAPADGAARPGDVGNNSARPPVGVAAGGEIRVLPAEAEEELESGVDTRGWQTVPVLRGDDAPPVLEQQRLPLPLAPTLPTSAPFAFLPFTLPTFPPFPLIPPAPTVAAPIVAAPTAAAPTSTAPTSTAPTATAPTAAAPTSTAPTAAALTAATPTVVAPTVAAPTAAAPTSTVPTATAPTSSAPTAAAPTSAAPLQPITTTSEPTTTSTAQTNTTTIPTTSTTNSTTTTTTTTTLSSKLVLQQQSLSNSTSNTTSPSASGNSTVTTTAATKTTTFEYPPVGPCRFSALYQTVFNGGRLLKRLLVDSPAQCLAACHYERCRSANLIQMEDKQKVCELFRDSIVEWRRNDVLSFDRLAVHFDSIQCQR